MKSAKCKSNQNLFEWSYIFPHQKNKNKTKKWWIYGFARVKFKDVFAIAF